MEKKKILLVDDDIMDILTLPKCLSRNFDVSIALDKDEISEEIKKNNPDLVLIDMETLGMENIKTNEEVQKLFNTEKIPTICMFSSVQVHEKFVKIPGFMDWFFKPISPEELIEKINSLLKKETEKPSE